MGNTQQQATRARTPEAKQARADNRANTSRPIMDRIQQMRERLSSKQPTNGSTSGNSIVAYGSSNNNNNAIVASNAENEKILKILNTLQSQMERDAKPFTKADFIIVIVSLRPEFAMRLEELQKLTIPELIFIIRAETCDVDKIMTRIVQFNNQGTTTTNTPNNNNIAIGGGSGGNKIRGGSIANNNNFLPIQNNSNNNSTNNLQLTTI